MRCLSRSASWLLLAGLLCACNGNGMDSTVAPPPALTPQRGDLLTSPPAKLASYSTTALLAQLAGSDTGKLLLQLAYPPKCSIDVYQLQYQTVGGAAESTSASGALIVPTGSAAGCSSGRAIVLYAHGTSADKNFNIADLTSSSNDEGLILAALFAAEGYIVVAPNYVGYDTSSLGYHPYLNADAQSKDMIDALTAARTALPLLSMVTVTDSGKLFITGYSQGGFVAMATHRALQSAGKSVTASAPMSGPYALAAFGDALFYGEVAMGSTVNLTLLATSYQHAYKNIYSTPGDMFEAKFAANIEGLLPSTTSTSTLYSAGKLPQDQLFSSTPPAPAFAADTPSTTPANLAPVFAQGFGADNLILNSYRLAYLQDAQMNPDGGFPTTTSGLPAATPAQALRIALKKNDQRSWTPNNPVLLCAGDSDPTVLYFNTLLMQGYWASHAPRGPVTFLDIDSSVVSGDVYAGLKTGFAAAKAAVAASAVVGGASDGGASAVLAAYHTALVPPFCVSAVKQFFDGQ